MTPNFDERLASIIRSLTEVVLPHLPPEASLAQEQVHLCIGHLQILRAQFDQVPAFERGELDDAATIGKALAAATSGQVSAAVTQAVAAADGSDVRGQRKAIHEAIAQLIGSVKGDEKREVTRIVLEMEHARAQKDRHWFAPFGFDTL